MIQLFTSKFTICVLFHEGMPVSLGYKHVAAFFACYSTFRIAMLFFYEWF